jgi:hypothetical protein
MSEDPDGPTSSGEPGTPSPADKDVFQSLMKGLRPPEQELMRLLASGLTSREIASKLGLNTHIVARRLARARQTLLSLHKRRKASASPEHEVPNTDAIVHPDQASQQPSAAFHIVFSPELTPDQIKGGLEAIADYFRACGGVGLEVEFDGTEVAITEPSCNGCRSSPASFSRCSPVRSSHSSPTV